jgi:hypothetical protein
MLILQFSIFVTVFLWLVTMALITTNFWILAGCFFGIVYNLYVFVVVADDNGY